jgi:hypothetical protein
MKDDRREGPPNVQLWSREGFGGPLSVLIRPTNGTEYISVQGPHAPRRAALERMTPGRSNGSSGASLRCGDVEDWRSAACLWAHSAYALRRQECGR